LQPIFSAKIAKAHPTSHQAKRGKSLGQEKIIKAPPKPVKPKAYATKVVGDITDWEDQASIYSDNQVPHYHTWILLPNGWTQKWVEGAQLPRRILSKYHASLTSIAATRGKRVAQPRTRIIIDEEKMDDDYAEDEHDDDEEEEVIEDTEDEDDMDFIVPDEDMEEEGNEEEEEEEVEEGGGKDEAALAVSDGEEIEEDCEPNQ
jgi:hypothetical protein